MSEPGPVSPTGEAAGVQGVSTIFHPPAHPVLKSIDPKMVSLFLSERRRYETEVAEKKKEIPAMSPAPFKVCIALSPLENVHFTGAFDDIAPNTEVEVLTSEQIEKYIHSLTAHDENQEVDPALVENATRGVRVQTNVENPSARIMQFVNDVFVLLEGVGYGNFKTTTRKLKNFCSRNCTQKSLKAR